MEAWRIRGPHLEGAIRRYTLVKDRTRVFICSRLVLGMIDRRGVGGISFWISAQSGERLLIGCNP